MVRKMGDVRVEELIRSLCDKVLVTKKDKDQARDIASIGLKTAIQEMPGGSLAATCAAIITTKMLDGAAKEVGL